MEGVESLDQSLPYHASPLRNRPDPAAGLAVEMTGEKDSESAATCSIQKLLTAIENFLPVADLWHNADTCMSDTRSAQEEGVQISASVSRTAIPKACFIATPPWLASGSGHRAD